jgi:dihydroorotate dehydrogenase
VELYRPLLLPLLSRTDPEWIHERTLGGLSALQRLAPGRALLRAVAGRVPDRPVTVMGLAFPNPLGVAAGLDKDCRALHAWGCLGFGHVEAGTLTPRPQAGNPRPRIFRLRQDRALVNRMGFPNGGVEAAAPRLAAHARRPGRALVGVSLGKQKETPLAEAAADYRRVLEVVYPHADYLAVNVSSPNTPGLRELQGGRYLETLLSEVAERGREKAAEMGLTPRPLVVKIAPDLTEAELDEVLEAAQRSGVAGIVATNTTLARDGLTSVHREQSGGLSGAPLRRRSTEVVASIRRRFAAGPGEGIPIIAVGGVDSAEAVREKLDAGASLVQLYTGLVYRGPGLAGRVLRGL